MKNVVLIGIGLFFLAACSVNTIDTQAQDNGSVQTQWQFNTLSWANEGATSGMSWETGNGNWGWGNGELEYYQAANATAANGILTITAKKQSMGGFAYTSARGNGGTLSGNGRVEARIQCPKGQGFWNAFWLLGSGGWPACGEIDIMEGVNSAQSVSSTCHWYENGNASYGASKAVNMNAYHTYTMERDSTYIKSYVDGSLFYTIKITTAGTTELKNPMHIIVNLAVGGTWPGSPNSSTPFPSTMNIDYMRIYK
jgi:beta-glucanase (GH16 family)